MAKTFREFVLRGNVMDLAVAVILGAAFTKIVNSLVEDVIMPPIGMLLGDVDFINLFAVLREGTKAPAPYATLAEAQAAGAVTINYGVFLGAIVTFVIVAWVVWMLLRNVERMGPPKAAPAPATKDCPYCLSSVPIKAVKCAHCGSALT